jgi:cell wall-associated NlpC family hydrolase
MSKRITILILPVLMASCIFVVHDKKERGNLSTTDSSAAFAQPKDSVTATDSVRVDTSVVRAMLSSKDIDTRGVSPAAVVAFAKTLIGTPYRYGSTDPAVGFDCSGFFTYVFRHFGIVVPRSSIDFTGVGKEISLEESRPGDIVLFTGTDSTEKFVGHMGMIVSNEKGKPDFIHSTSGKQYGVTITSFGDYYRSRHMKTIRIFPG